MVLIQVAAAVVILFTLFIFSLWIVDYVQRRRVYNVKTGELIQGTSIFFLPWFLFAQKKESTMHYSLKLAKKLGKPVISGWAISKMIVRVRDPILAKQVLNETETFKHNVLDLVKYSTRFIGHDHLVGINDPQWSRQRKILDPAFKSLGNYFNIFSKKTAAVMHQMIEKDGPIIDDVHKYTQAMALDILGLSIFGYDFKSVEVEKEDDNLKSYNYLMDLFFNIKKALPAMITHNFESLSSTKETLKQIQIWENLRTSLIEVSKKKIQEKSIDSSNYSMLDMMVESLLENDSDEKLTQKEIIDNIGIFFLAGHET